MGSGPYVEGLTVIIPTYNFICVPLVQELCRQCRQYLSDGHYEILVYDDASTDLSTLTANRAIHDLPGCTFIENPFNKGRSRLRNQLIRDARFQYILIIDSDAEVCSPSFIQNYMEVIADYDIVIGGIQTSERYRRSDNLLRFRYEMAANRSIRQLDYCNQHPYWHFSTFNAMFHTKVFQQAMYNETITGYGFEDTLLGVELEKAGFRAIHINNPLIHTGIDSTDSFLEKTEESLQNLFQLYDAIGSYSTLCRWYERLKRWHIHRLMALWHTWAEEWERKHLYGKHPSLRVFNLYKLGRFTQIMVENKKRPHQ